MSLDMYYFEKNKELVTKMASGMEDVKCHPLFRPKFSKVKRRFAVEIL